MARSGRVRFQRGRVEIEPHHPGQSPQLPPGIEPGNRGKGGGFGFGVGHGQGIPPGVLLLLSGGSAATHGQVPPGDALQLIFSSTASGSVASIDTGANGIPAGFNHLLMLTCLRAATSSRSSIRFNNDSGANYSDNLIAVNAGSVSGGSDSSITGLALLPIDNGSDPANFFAMAATFIPFYGSSSYIKQATCIGYSGNATGGTARYDGGFWNSTAAITRITVINSIVSENLNASSAVYIYGF